MFRRDLIRETYIIQSCFGECLLDLRSDSRAVWDRLIRFPLFDVCLSYFILYRILVKFCRTINLWDDVIDYSHLFGRFVENDSQSHWSLHLSWLDHYMSQKLPLTITVWAEFDLGGADGFKVLELWYLFFAGTNGGLIYQHKRWHWGGPAIHES